MDAYHNLQELFTEKAIKIKNNCLNDLYSSFSFNLFQGEKDINNIIQSKAQFNYIFFSKYVENNSKTYFIACFDYTIVIIPQENIDLLYSFFKKNKYISIFCLDKSDKSIIQQSINMIQPDLHLNFVEFDLLFQQKEIPSLMAEFSLKIQKKTTKNIEQIKIFWISLTQCISCFLLKKSYSNSQYDLIKESENLFSTNNFKQIQLEKDNFIQLRNLGKGVSLIYHIKEEHLYVLKVFTEEKLFKRERDNFYNLHYPLLPRFFGTYKYNSYDCLIMEYIEGQKIENIHQMKLKIDIKMKMIFEMLLIFKYFHYHNYIYVDLKPDHLVIKNDTLYIFDFDRMRKADFADEKDELTADFFHEFIAPEIPLGNFLIKSDIFSIGKIIQFILLNEIENYPKLKEICYKCTLKDPSKRPNINQLVDLFFNEYYSKIMKIPEDCKIPAFSNLHNEFFFPYWLYLAEYQNPNSQIQIITWVNALFCPYGGMVLEGKQNNVQFLTKAAEQNCPRAQLSLGEMYLKGNKVSRDINKAIQYFLLASKLNIPEAHYCLGVVYFNEEYNHLDVKKSIYYFTLASNCGMAIANYFLGHIYSSVPGMIDIKKSLYYFSLAANENEPEAQFRLGFIYYEGILIKKDINRAIFLFTLSAKQNNAKAQHYLGNIYGSGKYVEKDIDKAIYYYKLASKQNYSDSLNDLGMIYLHEEKYIDMNKALYYFNKSADLNNIAAQRNLGFVYKDNYGKKDINKSIYYFTLSANQNDLDSMHQLGLIYYYNVDISRDINKSIYYFTIAANQRYTRSLFALGFIYSSGQFVPNDIEKAIYYYSLGSDLNDPASQNNLASIYQKNKEYDKAFHYYLLASNQNYRLAQCNLGLLYLNKSSKNFNIQKSIYYLSLAANGNLSNAQFFLGEIYSYGEYGIKKDINKALHYYLLAANQNQKDAQFELGLIYYKGKDVQKNIKKAIFYLTQAFNNGNKDSSFILGFIYHEGKYIERDIKKAIYYYKDASTFNNQYAKNNLGVIYKSGFGDLVPKNIAYAIEYFNETVYQKNDLLATFNLAKIYLYEFDGEDEYIMKSIDLLTKSLDNGFLQLYELLCLSLITKFGFDLEIIKKELDNIIGNSNYWSSKICGLIRFNHLNEFPAFKKLYNFYETIDYIYNDDKKGINNNILMKQKEKEILNIPVVNSDFYDGFYLE